MLSRICAKAGCNSLIPIKQTYCQAHAGIPNQQRRQSNRHYDTTRRNPKATAFYKSVPWVRMQAYIIQKYMGLDVYAYYTTGEILPATTVHHIDPLCKAWDKRLDPSNLIPLTASNHSTIHRLYARAQAATMTTLAHMLARFQAKYGITHR